MAGSPSTAAWRLQSFLARIHACCNGMARPEVKMEQVLFHMTMMLSQEPSCVWHTVAKTFWRSCCRGIYHPQSYTSVNKIQVV